jgi:hypothetical protein
MTQKKSSEKLIRDIKRNTRRKYSTEQILPRNSSFWNYIKSNRKSLKIN